MTVIKRDGSKVEFDINKIKTAITKAFQEVYKDSVFDMGPFWQRFLKIWEEQAHWKELMGLDWNVEQIQDVVENALMDYDKEVAKAYIIYRYNHGLLRKDKNSLVKAVTKKLMAENVDNQNANVDEYSFGGRMGEVTRLVTKQYALDNCMSKMAKNNHLNNEIYIHDLDSYAVGMHNCTVRETKFITDKGVFSFEEFKDGDSVVVLTHTGKFKPAVVKKYGHAMVNKITFSRAGQRFVTERFTENHRWILDDDSITTKLKVGDKIKKAPCLKKFIYDNASDSEKYYWCLGFVLADGTNAYRWSHGKKNEDIQFVRLRLCGDKVKYINNFNILTHSTKQMENGDLYLTFSSKINFIKKFPDLEDMSNDEKLALFDGLYCADGQQSGSRKSILTTNEQIASFIEDIVPSLGYYILNKNDKTGEITNYSKRDFTVEYTFTGYTNKYYWTVFNITPDCEEDLWCLEVEDDHSFILPNGIVTGNCLSIPFDDLLAKGFKTRQADVRPANSINTACQLIAVIFQIQSLQQFGGVSATHLDWTLAPYVTKSYRKHYDEGIKWMGAEEAHRYAREMTIKETYQGIEGLIHNLNTLQSRSGNQLPFTSVNFGTCTSWEGRLVTKAVLDNFIKGTGPLHSTPIFPCAIFQMMKGVNRQPGDSNYDLYQLALKSTSLRLYPNYANVDWSGNKGYDRFDPKTYFSTMGERKLWPM